MVGKKKVAVWGWWQGENLGDQWIKEIMQEIFPAAELIDTRNLIKGYDFVICGGGGLFIDKVPLHWKLASRRVRYGMIGLGAEFEHADFDARTLAEGAEFFFVRDEYSMRCMHLEQYPRSYDITFARPLELLDENLLQGEHCLFVWRTPGQEMLSNPRFAEYQRAEYDYYDWEKRVYRSFVHVKQDDFVTFESDVEKRIEGCDFVISGRYHGIVAAIQKGIPCIAIDLCPKIRALMQEAGLEEYCIKLNEADRLDDLIAKAKRDRWEIRRKEIEFRTAACRVIQEQILKAQTEVSRVVGE